MIGGDAIRYADMFKPPEKRSPEEIKDHIREKLRRMNDGSIHTGGDTDA